ncbi:UDP-N-acetylglucosamine--N-acetylmuramyl-(pentapeptide) pyrophosphoryl-undecaprenol N-acetylglucosamine transferase [Corynebacterium ciconiae DSM 44920]|uniref:undecaprenyldiphospho-muramoylpentapeptide beta-N-acetylglucosaminyltransferase n=1 Tax=Corynebacterium ciconiae TaxID=227319 RepID=UPI000375032B|nr:undecaprenyldiphospho-muramoylpentapeptide beta-N-acetylglucosaminyltransferase [Corynebacterium ciconiae]WKD60785.1 UDP-N-acetylglucosamine--N-acetylmuramyl-(pentapeptide) pyrophosphoryl-undecaprenol N-acetylglucosamine transferase [Corynebacterium ciconiae DSM 44920]
MSETTLSVVVAGGGTAGHIEPALAVADALRARDEHVRITALGTTRGLEVDLVPERGYELRTIPPVPVPRKPGPALATLPVKVLNSVRATIAVLKDVEADVLIGFGGYVSAPAYLAARRLGIPFFVHEANARAGMANKLGVRLGGTGLNAVADSGIAGDVVGVPIRSVHSQNRSEHAQQEARAEFGLDPHSPTLLVTGGSQGARSLNRAVAEGLEQLRAGGVQVLHAYGKKNEAPEAGEGYVPLPYISEMNKAYAAADIICCRAGAMTVAEVSASGTPAIYVPLPHGNGEQGLNAQPVISAGGATLIADAELTGHSLATQVLAILGDEQLYEAMVHATDQAGLGSAAEDIAERIVRSARG